MTSFRKGARRAKRAAAAALETTYRAAFAALGRFGERVPRWSSAGGQRVLVVAPHPDDETIGCGGTLARHVAKGDDVRVAFVTDGRMSRAFGLSAEEMASRRRREAEAASRALGATSVWMGLPERGWRGEEVVGRLSDLVRAFRPQILYAPSCVDFHPEHVRVARALAEVLGSGEVAVAPVVRVYPIQVPLTSVLVNLVSPVADVEERLAKALDAYETQAGSTGCALRQRRYAAARHGLPNLAEELWELPAAAFAALHSGSADGRLPFRGLRPFPLSDPLAYLVGRRERRRISRRAS